MAQAANNHPAPKYSVVVPVYMNEESLSDVISQLTLVSESLDGPLEAIFVVDGSPDNSHQRLEGLLPTATFRSRLLLHSRNFGSFAAIKSGFSVALGDYVAVMAADLQEPPGLIIELLTSLSKGGFDVALGTREGRHDPALSKALSRAYWSLYRRFVQRSMPRGGVDIFATNRVVTDRLVKMTEANSSLIGQLMWIGFRRVEIPYTRVARAHGSSAWSVRKKFKYLMDSIFSFTSLPVSLILFVGLVGTISTSVIALAVFSSWLLGGISVPGYAALMLVQLFSSGSLLFAMGILGTYIWRTFENSKMRPESIVMKDAAF